MTPSEYADFCKRLLLAKPEACEDFPFGPQAAVYRIRGKVFAIMTRAAAEPSVNLKCDPDHALALRDMFPGVIPGYHMNKKHWNTVLLNAEMPDSELKRMVDHSYALVVKGLRKLEREALVAQYGREILKD